jgi:hypothetical protein
MACRPGDQGSETLAELRITNQYGWKRSLSKGARHAEA